MKKFLLALGLALLLPLAHGEELLKEGHPDRYLVKEGDTLWEIASMFLTDAWMWPEIWHVNPNIENPHLIFPGDEILLSYVDGQPQLALRRGSSSDASQRPMQSVRQGDRSEKLVPTVRVQPLVSAIPAIPLDFIVSMLKTGRIVEQDTLENAPYVLAGTADRLVFGPGDQFYARGNWQEGTRIYGIYREGNVYQDPETSEVLGFEARLVGLARAVERNGDVITFDLTRVLEEVRIEDRLLPTEQARVESTFYPKPPTKDVDGVIMTVLGGLTQVGRNDVVVINRGDIHGIQVGTVLQVYKSGNKIRDRITRERVQLPPEAAGILMVFRSFEKMAYALILETEEPLRVGDAISNP